MGISSVRASGLALASCVLLLSASVGCQKAQSETTTQAKAPEAFYALPVSHQVVDHEDFTGHTQAVKTVTIRARVSGYLNKINFVDGAHVTAGDDLFDIDPRPYQADFDRLQATVLQNQRHTARTQQDLDRADKLIGSKAISQELYDQYLFDNLESKAALKSAEAALATASLNLSFTKVISPITGRVSSRMVDPGNLVVADTTPLTTIVSEDPVWAYFDIDEHTSLRIQRLDDKNKVKSPQAPEQIVYLGLVDEQDFPHKGKIDFVDNQVDTQTGTLRLRGVFSNDDGLLTPGLFVRIRLPIGEPHEALVIPEAALQTDQGRKFVYVIKSPDDVIEYRGVTVGDIFSTGTRVIEQGLKPNDRVVVSGLQRVKPGVKVDAKLETQNPSTPAKSGEAKKPSSDSGTAAKSADDGSGNPTTARPKPRDPASGFGPTQPDARPDADRPDATPRQQVPASSSEGYGPAPGKSLPGGSPLMPAHPGSQVPAGRVPSTTDPATSGPGFGGPSLGGPGNANPSGANPSSAGPGFGPPGDSRPSTSPRPSLPFGPLPSGSGPQNSQPERK